jgi:polysaccharide export outer membrane protein
MIPRRYFLVALVAGWAVSGLGADTNRLPVVVGPSSARGLGKAVQDGWRLGPNDVISVTVFQEDDLKTKTIIDTNGMVMLPLLGQVGIGSMTVAEASALIQRLYNKDYLVNARVNLVIESFAERRFSVLGQVQRPGSFEIPQNASVDLLEGIAMAGGFTRLGAPSKVVVRRMEKGSPRIYHLDADLLSRDPSQKSFEITPNDVITVGERTF